MANEAIPTSPQARHWLLTNMAQTGGGFLLTAIGTCAMAVICGYSGSTVGMVGFSILSGISLIFGIVALVTAYLRSKKETVKEEPKTLNGASQEADKAAQERKIAFHNSLIGKPVSSVPSKKVHKCPERKPNPDEIALLNGAKTFVKIISEETNLGEFGYSVLFFNQTEVTWVSSNDVIALDQEKLLD